MKYSILRKTGRLANGFEGGGGALYHAVVNGAALCGTRPGRLSDWGCYAGEKVTCKKCISKLSKEGSK